MFKYIGKFFMFRVIMVIHHQACKAAGWIHMINLTADLFIVNWCQAVLLKCTEQNVNNQSHTILITLCSHFLLFLK